MVAVPFSLREDYWTTFNLLEEDVEFLYNYLLEKEIPLTSRELMSALVGERIQREKLAMERQRSSRGDVYFPKDGFALKQNLVFPALDWRRGKVVATRKGWNPDLGEFDVIRVKFEGSEEREFASGLPNHYLNNPPQFSELDPSLDPSFVLDTYGESLVEGLEADLEKNQNFVRIAGRWFPRALLMDITPGHLNLAEAILDVAGGGPMITSALLEQIDIASSINPKLLEFSFDLALEEDPRFDEVGPAGEILWYLQRLEPAEVQQTPTYLRYTEMEHDRSLLTQAMLELERELDDELSPVGGKYQTENVEIRLIFPHWRAGTLPLSARMRHIFPTSYEAPRIRFMLVDGDTGERFPGWVIRQNRYVYGLGEWYKTHDLMPGSLLRVKNGKRPGEVIVQSENRRPTREWIRTLLVGSDGGVVFAMLKQVVSAAYDERMAIAVPDIEAVDRVWERYQKERVPFERIVVNTVRELAKLNPQSHVHTSELYAAVNIIRRCPPGPILALLASRPWFVHVGDLHYRFDDSERAG